MSTRAFDKMRACHWPRQRKLDSYDQRLKGALLRGGVLWCRRDAQLPLFASCGCTAEVLVKRVGGDGGASRHNAQHGVAHVEPRWHAVREHREHAKLPAVQPQPAEVLQAFQRQLGEAGGEAVICMICMTARSDLRGSHHTVICMAAHSDLYGSTTTQ